MSKKIRVTVIRGMDLHTHTLSAPSPYVVVIVGTEKKETKPVHHEHNPAWQESFVMDVNDPNIGVLNLEARSHGIENHLIGTGQIPINNLLKDQTKREIVQLNPRGQLEIELFAEDFGFQQPGVAPGVAPGFPPQQPAYGAPGYPPQQPGYPPQPYGGYPPQQPGYGAPPPGYEYQQPGYPPQQASPYGYPPY